jgi:hypothetical protein
LHPYLIYMGTARMKREEVVKHKSEARNPKQREF